MLNVYEIAPYGSVLIVGIGEDPHHVAATLNINNQGIEVDYPLDSVAGVTFERILRLPGTKSEKQYIIIIIHPKYANPMTVAHEAVHAVNFVFKHVGVELDIDNDEPQAYLTGYIVNKIHETITAFKKNRKKKK